MYPATAPPMLPDDDASDDCAPLAHALYIIEFASTANTPPQIHRPQDETAAKRIIDAQANLSHTKARDWESRAKRMR